MRENFRIIPPSGEDDLEGAKRVFEDFFVLYQPMLVRAENYLEHAMQDLEPEFASAYRPWHKALHDLLRGVHLITKNIPLPDTQGLREALNMFTFDSAIEFLRDICNHCLIPLAQDWADRFRQHVHLLLFSLAILNRQQQLAPAR